MANKRQLEILKQGVEAWNQWRVNHLDVTIALSEADLQEKNLRTADLSGVFLLRANLSRTDLRGADLYKADLRWSNLGWSDLSNVNLSEADLRETVLCKAKFLDAKMRRANLAAADLRAADLSGADLTYADLNGANLSHANLSRTYLTMADLTGANLSGADLSDSELVNANLFDADLSRANLNNANLWSAAFRDNEMDNMSLSNAQCSATSFNGVDLSTVEGLESVRHYGRSYLDIHTLYLSQGKIPDVFLRGCGIPEELITYLPSLVGKAIDFYSCFISYSHTDKSFARRLHDALQGQGIRCWLDEKQVNPGDDIYEEIDRGIRYWDKVLLCCSKSSLSEKWWVDHEIDKAFQKERELMKERRRKVHALIPIDLDGFLFDDAYTSGKAQQIRSRIAADFKGWQNDNAIFERGFERVVKALRTDGGKEPPPDPKL